MLVPLIEMFSSIQGEGPFVGCRQLFLRFSGCNLNCNYCDTDFSPTKNFCKVEKAPGSNEFQQLQWPLELNEIVKFINNKYNLSQHHSISLTGGEPLLHADLLKEMVPLLQGTRSGIFLETNGTLYHQLQNIIEYIDIISMDIKLPSVAGVKPYWEEHRQFIRVTRSKEVNLYLKVVVSDQTSEEDWQNLFALYKEEGLRSTLIIQPVTPYNHVHSPSIQQLLQWQNEALHHIGEVRIIPQTHRPMGVL